MIRDDAIPSWLLIVLALVAFFMLVGIKAARAHTAPSGWQYGAECCSERDCFEMAEADTPKPLDGGDWLLTTGEIVPVRKVKWSPDGRFHLCRLPGGTIVCLYIPPQGS